MEGTEGYDNKEVFDLATIFEAAARSDAKLVKDASSEFSLTANLQKIINNNTSRKVKVSQNFFEKANAYRTSICSIERWLREGILSDPTQRIKAQQMLLDLSSDFNSIKADLLPRIIDLERASKSAKRGIFERYDFNGAKRVQSGGQISVEVGSEYTIFQQLVDLEKANNYSEIIRVAETQIKITPSWLTPYLFLGVAYAHLGETQKAIENLQYVVDESGGDPDYKQANVILDKLKQIH